MWGFFFLDFLETCADKLLPAGAGKKIQTLITKMIKFSTNRVANIFVTSIGIADDTLRCGRFVEETRICLLNGTAATQYSIFNAQFFELSAQYHRRIFIVMSTIPPYCHSSY